MWVEENVICLALHISFLLKIGCLYVYWVKGPQPVLCWCCCSCWEVLYCTPVKLRQSLMWLPMWQHTTVTSAHPSSLVFFHWSGLFVSFTQVSFALFCLWYMDHFVSLPVKSRVVVSSHLKRTNSSCTRSLYSCCSHAIICSFKCVSNDPVVFGPHFPFYLWFHQWKCCHIKQQYKRSAMLLLSSFAMFNWNHMVNISLDKTNTPVFKWLVLNMWENICVHAAGHMLCFHQVF